MGLAEGRMPRPVHPAGQVMMADLRELTAGEMEMAANQRCCKRWITLQGWGLPPSRKFLLLSSLVLLPVISTPASAQTRLLPSIPDHRQVIDTFERVSAEPRGSARLECSVQPVNPTLNFRFRFQTGYRVTIPVRQFQGRASHLIAVQRIRNVAANRDQHQPYYFWQSANLPALREVPNRGEINLGGGVYAGEGQYEVEWILMDDRERVCRKQWRFRVNPKRDERELATLTTPGKVEPVSPPNWNELARRAANTQQDSLRVAVFLHAAPLYPRASTLNTFDQGLLMSTLSSLVEEPGLRVTSITLFNLDQQKELARVERPDSRGARTLMRAMRELNFATIDVAQLSRPEGAADLLVYLINREIQSDAQPEAFIFLGPKTRHGLPFSKAQLELLPSSRPPIFYLRYDHFGVALPFPDTLEKMTKAARGETFSIRHPRELAAAMREMEEDLRRLRRQASLSVLPPDPQRASTNLGDTSRWTLLPPARNGLNSVRISSK
jgi:hypothetical protein